MEFWKVEIWKLYMLVFWNLMIWKFTILDFLNLKIWNVEKLTFENLINRHLKFKIRISDKHNILKMSIFEIWEFMFVCVLNKIEIWILTKTMKLRTVKICFLLETNIKKNSHTNIKSCKFEMWKHEIMEIRNLKIMSFWNLKFWKYEIWKFVFVFYWTLKVWEHCELWFFGILNFWKSEISKIWIKQQWNYENKHKFEDFEIIKYEIWNSETLKFCKFEIWKTKNK